uniref:protein-serine/threonine phosphatase n=1 Tax=Quercus lobata TaxID=97700 RepID=A0A7N2MMQ7_QUELO
MKIISVKGFPQDLSDMASSSSSNLNLHTRKANIRIERVESTETCAHPSVERGACMVCKSRVFMYIDKDLWLSPDEIDGIRKVESERLLNDRKLVLVLDLDNTLLHTTGERKHLKTRQELLQHNIKEDGLIPLKHYGMMLKLRPFVHTFLKEANEKSLLLVMRHQRMVLVLDDTECVWRNHRHNLILVKRYDYFDARHDLVSLSAMNNDEGETTGVLATILKKLKLIHRLFFNPKFKGSLAYRDVTMILDRLQVLQGCKLTFEGIFPSGFKPQNSRLWMMAEELGAICSTSVFTSWTRDHFGSHRGGVSRGGAGQNDFGSSSLVTLLLRESQKVS